MMLVDVFLLRSKRKDIVRVLPILLLLTFLFFFGCTSSPDTFIVNNVKLERLFDGNVVGDVGLVPFLNVDGNALSVQSGFDFNSDTNTLRADFFVGDISGATGIYRDLDGGSANSVYLPSQLVDGGKADNS
jgi:hypothetical protein